MADLPVFISYDRADQPFAHQLATDLGARGVHVMPDGYTMSPDHAKNAMLSQAQWLLLVRSPQAELSPRVQDEVDAAMRYTVNQRMQGVLSVSRVPSVQAGPPTWSVIRSFNADEPSYERSLQALLRIMSAGQSAQPPVQASAAGTRYAQAAEPVQPVHRPTAVRNGVRKSRTPAIIAAATLIVVLMAVTGYALVKTRSTSGAYLTLTTPKPGATIAVNATPTVMPSPTPTATPIANPQAFYNQLQQRTPTLSDSMDGTSSNKWDKQDSLCAFAPHYHVAAPPGRYTPCMLQGSSYTNFAYQVLMTVNDGGAGGLIFRANQASQPMTMFYRFSLATSGDIALIACTTTCMGNQVTTEGTPTTLQPSPVVYQPGVKNIITIIVSGVDFYLFVNQKFVDHVTDAQIQTGGGIGLYAASISDASPAALAAFSDLKVWTL